MIIILIPIIYNIVFIILLLMQYYDVLIIHSIYIHNSNGNKKVFDNNM